MALNNSEELTNFLRQTQVIDQNGYQKIIELSKNKPIHLFEMGKMTRKILLVSRWQVYFYSVFGLAYICIDGTKKYERYKEELANLDPNIKYYESKSDNLKSKINKLSLAATLFGITSVLGLILTLRMGKRIPKNIYFHNQNLEIQYYSTFCRTKRILAPLNSLKNYAQTSKLDKTVEFTFQGRKISTLGTGVSHRNLMKYLTEVP